MSEPTAAASLAMERWCQVLPARMAGWTTRADRHRPGAVTMAELAGRGWSSAREEVQIADVVLLRHGDTRLSPERRFSGVGSADPGLSAAGRDQARHAADSALLQGSAFTEVLTSPMTRCQETARIVAAALGVSVVVDRDLREMDFGLWEEMTFDEVQDRYPEDLLRWTQTASASPTGSSESIAAVVDRMGTAAARFASRYAGSSVLAITHVTPMKALVAHALGAPPAALFHMEVSSACFSRITYSGGEASVRLFNDTSHLR
jgi:ribonuclease H / adenosylcobalamin/alpha-ribazole phosphatase